MDFFALASSSMLYGKVRAFWINLWIYSYFLRLNLLRLCCYCPKNKYIYLIPIKLPYTYLLNPFEITMSKDMIKFKTKLWAKRRKMSSFIITCNSTCTCTKLHSLLNQGLQDLSLTQKSVKPTPWLTRIGYMWILLTRPLKKSPFLTWHVLSLH